MEYSVTPLLYKNKIIKMAINCDLPAGGYNPPCYGASGVLEVYIANFLDGTTYTEDSTGLITGFTPGTPGQMAYYTYYQDSGDASLTDEAQVSKENGAVAFQPSVTIILKDLDSDLRQQILALSRARTSVILKDRRDRYWLVGKDAGLRMSTATSGLGKAATDLYGATITLMGDENELFQEIDSTAIGSWDIT